MYIYYNRYCIYHAVANLKIIVNLVWECKNRWWISDTIT